jgi:hypothetical protein
MSGALTAWRDVASKRAIVDFVERMTAEGGPDFVPPSDRVAVYDNEFAYTDGAEQALDRAARDGWTVASIKDDWSSVFPLDGTARRP